MPTNFRAGSDLQKGMVVTERLQSISTNLASASDWPGDSDRCSLKAMLSVLELQYRQVFELSRNRSARELSRRID